MPWQVYGKCVHKKNPDGSRGELVKCHETSAKAAAHARALYANVEEKMATKKVREKRRERRRRYTQLEKAKAVELEPLEEDEISIEDQDAELEEALAEAAEKEVGGAIEKDMYGAEMSMMGMGPTSFAELDEMHEAMARNHEIQETAWDVQDLVRNIIYHPAFSVEEKSSAIKSVGDEFGSRVKSIMDSPVEKELDMDLLEIEAMVAKEYRHLSVAEKVGDWISKATLSTEARKKLSDEDFALPSKKKYPIHDKAHVRNALARAAQMMKRGGEAATDARSALPKIRAAAKKMGIGMEKGLIVEKDASGSWRWVGYPTNNFVDHSGDIITEAAHQEYTEWVNKDIAQNAPVFTSCHAPGTVRENPVDFVAYENGFLVMSGKLTEKEAAALLKASTRCEIGMSHTSWGWRDEKHPEQIIKYRSFEVTDLPIETADNPFTLLEISKEATVDQLAYLTELLGSKEKAEQALKLKTSMKQKELQEAGVESKGQEKPVEAKAEATPPEPAKAEANTDAIVAKVLKELDVEGLQDYLSKANEALEKVPVLEDLVKELSQKQDDRLAEMITPKAERKFLWSKARASESDKTVVEGEEKEKLTKSTAGIDDGWANALGVTPLTQ